MDSTDMPYVCVIYAIYQECGYYIYVFVLYCNIEFKLMYEC